MPLPLPTTTTTRIVLGQARQFLTERFASNTYDFLNDRQPLIWLLAMITGALVGVAAILFRLLIGYIQLPWLGTTSESVATTAEQSNCHGR